ncbi:hypothetical protein B0H19DRAFT_1367491 [Mycena capillaripes]|nr:hypothetical protein B0H19DRAFT_1367491 [Mycena capillaripes]
MVLFFIAIPFIISLPPPTIWRTVTDDCAFAQCMSMPEAPLASSLTAFRRDGVIVDVRRSLGILKLASTVSTLLSPIIALCLAACIVVCLRALADQPHCSRSALWVRLAHCQSGRRSVVF